MRWDGMEWNGMECRHKQSYVVLQRFAAFNFESWWEIDLGFSKATKNSLFFHFLKQLIHSKQLLILFTLNQLYHLLELLMPA